MRLRTKFGIHFVLVFALTTVAVLGVQWHWIENLVIDQTTQRMKHNMYAAWSVLRRHQDRLDALAGLLAENVALTPWRDAPVELLSSTLDEAATRWHADFLHLLRADGTVFVRGNSATRDDRSVLLGAGDPSEFSGFAAIPAGDIAKEGGAFVARCRVGDQPGDALVMYSVKAIRDANGTATGFLAAGMLLNGADKVVDEIQHTLFEDRIYKGKRSGAVTLFLGPERVATTVLLEDGQRALSTRVSEAVEKQVLGEGKSWTGRAWLVNDWYLCRYDPLRDRDGKVAGILYVGELERTYTDQRANTLWSITGVLLVVMLFAFCTVYWLSQRTLKQISALDNATARFASGDFEARTDIHTSDEIGELSQRLNALADRIVHDRNELLHQKAEIEQINHNYMDMLGFVSHEFRSPLASALLNAQLLENGSYGPLAEDQPEGISLIINSLRHLQEITESYLQLARIERGEFTVRPQRVWLLDDVIEPVRQRMEAALEAKRMTLTVDVPKELDLDADVNLLRVVYENLVGNAVKYGGTGGAIRLSARRLQGEVELEVWNDGQPIPAERLPLLFGKFRRFDGVEQSAKVGTGLGLFIVKKIVEGHHGAIRVESSEGQGTRFVFTLKVGLK